VNGVDPTGFEDGNPINPIGAEGIGLSVSSETVADESDWAEHGGAELLQNQGLEELKDNYQGCDEDCGNQSSESKESEEAEQNCWGNPETLQDHFDRHGSDFGSASATEYAQEAQEFLQLAEAEGFPTKVDSSGIIRIYDPSTDTFGSYNPDGTTRTFFKPESSTYWDRQPGISIRTP
jgi:hypothetical protein